jgi:hypothetical protein
MANEITWQVGTMQRFEEDVERLQVSSETVNAIKEWAKTVRLVEVPVFKLICNLKGSNPVSVYSAHIPDPDHNKGASSGFRLLIFFDRTKKIAFLDRLDQRKELGFKKEQPKKKSEYQKYIKALISYLCKEYGCAI